MKSFENLNDYKNYRAWFLGTLTRIKSQEKCRTRMMKLSLSLSLRCALRMQLCYIRWFATHAGGHSLFFVFLYLKYLGKIYFNPNSSAPPMIFPQASIWRLKAASNLEAAKSTLLQKSCPNQIILADLLPQLLKVDLQIRKDFFIWATFI